MWAMTRWEPVKVALLRRFAFAFLNTNTNLVFPLHGHLSRSSSWTAATCTAAEHLLLLSLPHLTLVLLLPLVWLTGFRQSVFHSFTTNIFAGFWPSTSNFTVGISSRLPLPKSTISSPLSPLCRLPQREPLGARYKQKTQFTLKI